MSQSNEGRPHGQEKVDVKSQIALTLIEAMKDGNTPWQRPWSVRSMRPMNPTSGNAYRGINRILLALAGRGDPRWMTYQQAREKGWQVRRGEQGSTIVKLVDFSPRENETSAENICGENGAQGQDQQERQGSRKTLRRYTVFNAQQIDGPPELESEAPLEFDPVEKAEGILQALVESTGLLIVHGGNVACYVPSLDEIRLPPRTAFHSVYDFYSIALHEAAHSTLSDKRMARREALAKRWGDETYSLEELRAEICSAILACETGVPVCQSADHIASHAAYLNAWVKSVGNDPMALMSAAKDAEKMAEYLLDLQAKRVAVASHAEWVQDYEQEDERRVLEIAR